MLHGCLIYDDQENLVEEFIENELQSAKEQVAVTTEGERLPIGTEDVIPLKSLIIPEDFLKFNPNPQKTQIVINFIEENGNLVEPIIIEKDSKTLIDGYRRYVAAKTLKMKNVPVCYHFGYSSFCVVQVKCGFRKIMETLSLTPNLCHIDKEE